MSENFFNQINRRRISTEHRFFSFLRRISLPLSKVAFFVVFFWFGILKMMELSPAEGVVHTLYQHTVPFIPWKLFIMGFGAYECLIGIIFLFPGKEKWALYMLIPHMITTFGPLVMMPNLTWKGFLVPNLIGQYIIKNVVIIALAIFISASVAEVREQKKDEKSLPKERKIKIA
jgi:uncharacterized membrane protein YkgB